MCSGPIVSFPTDHSLTCSRVLAALQSVEESDRVGGMLDVWSHRREELKGKSASDSQYRESLVKYWLETHPFASWEHLGGVLLRNEETAALQDVKRGIKPERGGQL